MSAKRKVFFALLPSTKTRDSIMSLQKKIKKNPGKWIAPQNIHITLCFIGYVDELELKCIDEIAETLEGGKVKFALDVIGSFKRASIVWLGSRRKCEPVSDLNDALCEKLAFCGLKLNAKKFRAHITLARKADVSISAPEFNSIEWCSDFFYLMESVQIPNGVEYKILKKYLLN